MLRGDIRDRVEELFLEIGEGNDIEFDTLEIAEDHVHQVKREMRGGEFWENGYFARTVGDEVTAKVIRRYIEYHDEEETRPNQLDLFDQ